MSDSRIQLRRRAPSRPQPRSYLRPLVLTPMVLTATALYATTLHPAVWRLPGTEISHIVSLLPPAERKPATAADPATLAAQTQARAARQARRNQALDETEARAAYGDENFALLAAAGAGYGMDHAEDDHAHGWHAGSSSGHQASSAPGSSSGRTAAYAYHQTHHFPGLGGQGSSDSTGGANGSGSTGATDRGAGGSDGRGAGGSDGHGAGGSDGHGAGGSGDSGGYGEFPPPPGYFDENTPPPVINTDNGPNQGQAPSSLVPEPSALALIGLGLGLLGLRRSRHGQRP